MGWFILSGNIEFNEEEKYTLLGGEKETVIDYVIVDNEVREVEKLEAGDHIDYDHFFVIVRLKGERNNKNMEKSKEIKELIKEKKKDIRLIIGKDFNARREVRGGREGGGERGRKSKEKRLNGWGKKLLRSLEEMGWFIRSGNIEGNEKEEYTLSGGQKGTVIDYVITDNEVREVEKLEVEDYIDYNHFSIIVKLK